MPVLAGLITSISIGKPTSLPFLRDLVAYILHLYEWRSRCKGWGGGKVKRVYGTDRMRLAGKEGRGKWVDDMFSHNAGYADNMLASAWKTPATFVGIPLCITVLVFQERSLLSSIALLKVRVAVFHENQISVLTLHRSWNE